MSYGTYAASLAIAIFLWILFKIAPFFRTLWRSSKAMKQFPMEDYHWLAGHLTVHSGPTHEGFMLNDKWVAKYPRYYVFYLTRIRPILALNHPETVKQMLKTAEPKPFSGGGGYLLLLPWIGEGLLLSSGKKWYRNRKLLTPGFHFDILKPYIRVYNSCVEKLMDNFEKNSAKTGKSVDVYMPVSMCTLDIVLRCAFSTERDIQTKGQSDPYVNNVVSLSRLLYYRGMRPYIYLDGLYYHTSSGREFKHHCDFSKQFADSVISKRKKELAGVNSSTASGNRYVGKFGNESNRYVDFLDILLLARDEFGNGLTDTEIRDEVETFMFEGHDTTASAITWILYNLARHPEIQTKARGEVDALLSDRASDWILWEDLNELPYLTMCIKESLRLHPPVPVIGRETTKPFELDGKTLPAGCFVDIVIWNVHHNPTVWKDPLTYKPERFLPENMKQMDSHAFIPFSAGPRNCIGQNFAMHEIKVVIARILRRFEFTLDETKEIRFKPELVLRPENGLYLTFKTRNIPN